MKVVVINGTSRHGSTWHCKELLLEAVSKHEQVETTEFVLPRDMPHFCNGCFSCIMRGEDKCPHAQYIDPIVKAMEDADLIVLTSSVYALDVSGQLKTLLDHLCFMWLSHRPNPKMFTKVGVTMTTTAGTGLGHTTKTMTSSLKCWGVKRVFTFKKTVAAMKWDDISERKKEDIQKGTAILARKIVKAKNKMDSLNPTLFTRFLFSAMKAMMKKNTWNLHDRNHWEAQGWLSGDKPF